MTNHFTLSTLPFNVNDTVSHKSFGTGTIISIYMDHDATTRNLAKYPQNDGCFQQHDHLITISFDDQSIGYKTLSFNIVITQNLLRFVDSSSYSKAS